MPVLQWRTSFNMGTTSYKYLPLLQLVRNPHSLRYTTLAFYLDIGTVASEGVALACCCARLEALNGRRHSQGTDRVLHAN